MADGRGAVSAGALKFGSTWGTAVECGANDGFRLDASSVAGGKEVIPDMALTGTGYGNAPNIGVESWAGSISGAFRYGGRCPELLAAIMGTAETPTEVEASYEYTHVLTFEDRLGDFFTWVEKRGDIQVWEYASAKVSRLVIEIDGKGRGSIEADLMLSSMIDDDSGTNTKSTFGNVTYRAPAVPVFLPDCRVWMNAQGGDALDSGDVIKPSMIRIEVDRKLEEVYKADQTLGRKMSEPEEGSDVDVFLQLGFPEYLANTYRGLVDDKTEQKASILMTSSAAPLTGAASGLYHQYAFDFPRLVPFERPDNAIGGPERITDGITFKGIVPSAAPTGMTAVVPFECTVRNQVSTNLLA